VTIAAREDRIFSGLHTSQVKLAIRSRFIAARSPGSEVFAILGHQAPDDINSRDRLARFGVDHSTGNGASLFLLGDGDVNIRVLRSFADVDRPGLGFSRGVGMKRALVKSPATVNPAG